MEPVDPFEGAWTPSHELKPPGPEDWTVVCAKCGRSWSLDNPNWGEEVQGTACFPHYSPEYKEVTMIGGETIRVRVN